MWRLLVTGLLGSSVLAEETVVREADKTIVRKKTSIRFSDANLEGELAKPEGSYFVSKRKTRFQSLIKTRENFNPELQKSADSF